LFLGYKTFREHMGGNPRKAILFEGPPGTGKTYMAKAMAREAGVPFLFIAASSIQSPYFGQTNRKIANFFKQLRKAARREGGAIGFIEEIDAIGVARAGMNKDPEARHDDRIVNRSLGEGFAGVINELLIQLQSFDEPTKREKMTGWGISRMNRLLPARFEIKKRPPVSSNILVIGATNRASALDPALLRPGRFDRQVYVSPPDLKAREQILNVHVRNKPIDDSVELSSVARATAGLTGADLENICNEAAIRATRAGRESITAVDFDDALERVVAGLKTHRMVSEDEKRVIAYHEAGHAVLAHIVGRGMTIHKVTIVPRGQALGYNMYLPTDERVLATRDDLITNIVVLLGGRAGEQVALGEVSNGAGDDLERCTAIARAMVFDWGLGESLTTRTVRADNFALSEDTKRQRDQEQSRICDYAYSEAIRLLQEHREALERLASKLLERETLDREDVATMLHDVQRVGTLAFSWPSGPAKPGSGLGLV
jgi:ATP-dependent Zn protease